jgi:diguanylate cyclase (GGDEF)-like protein
MIMSLGIRILVVDEDEKLQRILSQALSEDGHHVTQKTSGKTALNAFRKEPFPLVITDIEMRSMSGIRVLQEIKQLDRGSEVILITKYPAVETAIEALRCEAFDYIIKTYDSLDLIWSAVNRAVEKIRRAEEYRNQLDMLARQNSELESAWRVFKNSAVRDEVTGLYDHRYFHEALAVELDRSRRINRNMSVVFVDVIYHGNQSSTHWQEEKAQLFLAVARTVQSRLRRTDLLVRYRDDALAILLPETPRTGTLCVTDGIRQFLSEHPFGGSDARSTASMSIDMRTAVYPDDGSDVASLIDRSSHTAD